MQRRSRLFVGAAIFLALSILTAANGASANAEELPFSAVVGLTAADGVVVDFDKQTTVKLPEKISWFGNEAARLEWMQTSGGSAWVCSQGDPQKPADTNGGGLFGSQMIVIDGKRADFQQMTAEQLIAALAMNDPQRNAPMQPRGAFPATYLIQTPKNGRGILQILALTANGVKIRYKMIDFGPPPETTPAPEIPQNSAQPITPRRAAAGVPQRLQLVMESKGELPNDFLKKIDLVHAGVYDKPPYPGYSLEEGEPFPPQGQRKMVEYYILPIRTHAIVTVKYFPEKNFFVVWDTTESTHEICYGPFKGSPRDVWPLPKFDEPVTAYVRDESMDPDRAPLLARLVLPHASLPTNSDAPGSALALGKLVAAQPQNAMAWETHRVKLDVTEGGALADDFLQRLDFEKAPVHELFAPGYYAPKGDPLPISRKVTRYSVPGFMENSLPRVNGASQGGVHVDYFPELNYFMVVDGRLYEDHSPDYWNCYYGPFPGDPAQLPKETPAKSH